MASGYYQACIRCNTAHAADGYPVDCALYRDQLATAAHLFDESAQVRVNWGARSASAYREASGAPVIWYPITTVAAWPLKLRSDGESFRLRVRVSGAASSAHTVTFRVVVDTPSNLQRAAMATTLGTNVWEGQTSSTTPGYITPSGSNIIYLQAGAIAPSALRTFDAVAGATPITVSTVMVTARVYGETSDAAAAIRLFGLYIAEYVGT